MCEDEQGNLYISSLKRGLFIYNEKADTFTPLTYTPNPDLPIKFYILGIRMKYLSVPMVLE